MTSPLYVNRDGNAIQIQGSAINGPALSIVCAMLHQMGEVEGNSKVTLDFSKCEAVTQETMLPLIAQVVRYREKVGMETSVVPPELREDSELDMLFFNAGWLHHIQPTKYDPPPGSDRHLQATRFKTEDEAGEVTRMVTDFVNNTHGVSGDAVDAVEHALGEITDNVVRHAKSSVGGFVQGTTFQTGPEFIVADAGLGIPRTLRMYHDHPSALLEAIKHGVTSDPEGAGVGLYIAYRIGSLSNGQFELRSHLGQLIYNSLSGNAEARTQRVPYVGTSVRCRIGGNDFNLVSRAIDYMGEGWEPAESYSERIEREAAEADGSAGVDDTLVIGRDAVRDTGTRLGGKRVRLRLEKMLQEHDQITVDFAGVSVVTSSFADEVFGKLFVELGPRAFMSRVKLGNVSPTIDGLIDRAIVQRTKLGNEPSG